MVNGSSTILILTFALGFLGLGPEPDRAQELDGYVRTAKERWGFNGVVVVEYKGQRSLAGGYGEADTLFGDPLTMQTKFFVGSITKQFTAAAILLLRQDGRLKLSDPIGTHLPDYPVEPGEKITLNHLLNHSSGLPNYTSFPEISIRRGAAIQPRDIIASFKDRPLEFEPGTAFKYSNSGYILLGEVIEAVSGQSYEAFLHKRIFGPLGMRNTGYGRREMAHPDRAQGYTIDASGRMIGAAPVSYSILHSAGALYSTAEDLLKWHHALNKGQLLSPESLLRMLTPGPGNYGFGWWLESRYGRFRSFQDGFLDGYSCILDRWPDDDLIIIVLSNEDEAPVVKIANGIAGILFGQYAVEPVLKEAVAVRPERLTECVGVYRTHDGRDRLVVFENGTLYSYQRGHPAYSLLPEQTDNFFFQKDHTETLTFERDADGRVIGMIYSNGENALQFERIDDHTDDWLITDPSPLSPGLIKALTGDYVLDSTLTGGVYTLILSILPCNSQLCASISGDDPVPLRRRSDSTFVHQIADFEITFRYDSSGSAAGCIVRIGETQVSGTRSSASAGER
jgi:CubicO group peptidase (beta-lactamase class C family)